MSIMPWLKKYRVWDGSFEEEEEDIVELEEELVEEADVGKRGEMMHRLAEMKSVYALKVNESPTRGDEDARDSRIKALQKRVEYLESKLAETILTDEEQWYDTVDDQAWPAL